jgi:hypothetical protein
MLVLMPMVVAEGLFTQHAEGSCHGPIAGLECLAGSLSQLSDLQTQLSWVGEGFGVGADHGGESFHPLYHSNDGLRPACQLDGLSYEVPPLSGPFHGPILVSLSECVLGFAETLLSLGSLVLV